MPNGEWLNKIVSCLAVQ